MRYGAHVLTALRPSRVAALVALSLLGCTRSSSDAAPGLAAQPLTDVWVSPARLISRSYVESPPQWDGTRWWLLAGGVVRQVDSNGQPIDDGGIGVRPSAAVDCRLALSGNAAVVACSNDEFDGGFRLSTRRVTPAGALGVTTIDTVEAYPVLQLAASPSDLRLLWSTRYPDGGATTWDLVLDGNGVPVGSPTKWPQQSVTYDVLFDGVRYLALGSAPTNSSAPLQLFGLSGPSGEPRFTLPLAVTYSVGWGAGFGGDAQLLMVYGNELNTYQLIIDGGVTTSQLTLPYNTSSQVLRSVFRDGDHLIAYFESLTAGVNVQGARVSSDGGVTAIADLVSRAVTQSQTAQLLLGQAGVAPGVALQPWFINDFGRTGFVTPLLLTGVSAPAPLPPNLVGPTAATSTSPALAPFANSVALAWLGERNEDQAPFYFAEHVFAGGGVQSTPIEAGASKWPKVEYTRLEGPAIASSGSNAMLIWSETFDLRVLMLESDGGVPNPVPQKIDTGTVYRMAAVAFGANAYFALATSFSGVSLFRFNLQGVLQNPGGTDINSGFCEGASIGFDGQSFHALTVFFDASMIWQVIDATGAASAPVTLAAKGSGQVVSGPGYGLALVSTPDGGTQIVHLYADGGMAASPGFSTSGFDLLSKRAALTSSGGVDFAAVADPAIPGVTWARFDQSSGLTVTPVTVSPAPNTVALTAMPSGQVVLARDEAQGTHNHLHVDFVGSAPNGAACAGPFDCANLGCSQGLCCSAPCATPDAGAPDAGAPDAGAPDAGSSDAGVPDAAVVDAGSIADAGPVEADAGPLDSGVAAGDAGPGPALDAGVTSSDAGEGERSLHVGCGCEAIGGQGFGVFALAALQLMRRRRVARASVPPR